MSKPTIPKGWRTMRDRVLIRPGDKFMHPHSGEWELTGCRVEDRSRTDTSELDYIRRIRKAARSLQKGEKK